MKECLKRTNNIPRLDGRNSHFRQTRVLATQFHQTVDVSYRTVFSHFFFLNNVKFSLYKRRRMLLYYVYTRF